MKLDELSTRFGEDTARAICEELGGDTVYIPVMRQSLKPRILEMWAAGHPVETISERLGCSKSWAWKVVKF